MNRPAYFGEILQSASNQWIAASWNWQTYAPFGSIIIVEHEQYNSCACITQVQTASNEQNRIAQPLQKNQNELARDYPHLSQLLQTTITGTPIGYLDAKNFINQPSPQIPNIHTFIRNATIEEYTRILHGNNPFQLLSAHIQPPFIDILILAMLKECYRQTTPNETFTDHIIDNIILLAGHDYIRIQQFVANLETLLIQDHHV